MAFALTPFSVMALLKEMANAGNCAAITKIAAAAPAVCDRSYFDADTAKAIILELSMVVIYGSMEDIIEVRNVIQGIAYRVTPLCVPLNILQKRLCNPGADIGTLEALPWPLRATLGDMIVGAQ